MVYKITGLTIPILIFLLSFSTVQKINNPPRLPVHLVYKSNTPDSIQLFIKLYLQSKKIKVVDQDELRKLVGDEIMSAAEDFIRNDGPNKKAENFIGNRLDPVGNIIALQLYNTWGTDSSYLIDSIKWKINHVPAKDTIPAVRRCFINLNTGEENLYIALKSFVDEVLSSGYIK